MTEQQAKRIVKKLKNNGIEADIYEGYSGRGMFGAKTAGVTVDPAWMRSEAEGLCPSLKKMRYDSLGLGMIYY